MKQFNISGPITATENGDFLYKSDVQLVLLKTKEALKRDLDYICKYPTGDESYNEQRKRELEEQINLVQKILKEFNLT